MNKIRLYDLLSFLLPGIFLCFALLIFFTFVIGILPNWATLMKMGSFGNSIIFLVLSFTIGHIIQVFGNNYESSQIKYWGVMPFKTAKHHDKFGEKRIFNIIATIIPILRIIPILGERIKIEIGLVPNPNGGWYSCQLLRPGEKTYDLNTKKTIRLAAEKIFGIPYDENDCENGDNGSRDKKNQLIFERIYRLILMKNIAPQTEDFNIQYGFYRGQCVTFLSLRGLAFISIGIFLLKSFFIWENNGTTNIFWQNIHNVFYSIGSFILFDDIYYLFRRRYERFAFYFANSVYQNFIVWWLSEQLNKQSQ